MAMAPLQPHQYVRLHPLGRFLVGLRCTFVVAHIHYVLSIGAVFALCAGSYYWIGKISGQQYPKTLGQIHFWIFSLLH